MAKLMIIQRFWAPTKRLQSLRTTSRRFRNPFWATERLQVTNLKMRDKSLLAARASTSQGTVLAQRWRRWMLQTPTAAIRERCSIRTSIWALWILGGEVSKSREGLISRVTWMSLTRLRPTILQTIGPRITWAISISLRACRALPQMREVVWIKLQTGFRELEEGLTDRAYQSLGKMSK